MTFSDRNDDLVTDQEKKLWVTPNISLMEADTTDGSKIPETQEFDTKVGVS